MTDVMATAKKIIANVERVIVGKRRQIVLSLVSWFCEGHILLEDVPGVAKTMLARTLAKSVGCKFKRIQCTPDLLPTDVTGASIFNQKTTEFQFRPGPIFAQTVLADEINRATPRTQSSFLEAMAEGRVTVDGVTHELEPPFLVIATQNPVDHEGTFPLPEAQLDRFLMRFSLGYPSMQDEIKMLELLQKERVLPASVYEAFSSVWYRWLSMWDLLEDGRWVSRQQATFLLGWRAFGDDSRGGGERGRGATAFQSHCGLRP